MTKDIIIKKTVQVIKKYLSEDCKIFLFGSWTKGDALDVSDIDIGILSKKQVPWSLMTKILQEKENIATLRSIDVVDLNSMEKSFKDNALKQAKILT